MNIALNKEQLCKIVLDMFKPLNDMGVGLIQPYKKIDSFLNISKMEKRTSNLIKISYLDEL
jgi:hypothetical protein